VKRSQETSVQMHEKTWEMEASLRQELGSLRSDLEKYAHALAEIAGVKD
jgi:hypothetical protein